MTVRFTFLHGRLGVRIAVIVVPRVFTLTNKIIIQCDSLNLIRDIAISFSFGVGMMAQVTFVDKAALMGRLVHIAQKTCTSTRLSFLHQLIGHPANTAGILQRTTTNVFHLKM